MSRTQLFGTKNQMFGTKYVEKKNGDTWYLENE